MTGADPEEGETLELRTGPVGFAGVVRWSEGWGFSLLWLAETGVWNIQFVRVVRVGVAWPPVQVSCGWLDVDGG